MPIVPYVEPFLPVLTILKCTVHRAKPPGKGSEMKYEIDACQVCLSQPTTNQAVSIKKAHIQEDHDTTGKHTIKHTLKHS